MKILVTGTPGSGKTTLVKYAQSLNDRRFYDADELSWLCEWREFKTSKVLGLVSEMEQKSNDEWFKNNGWYWREDKLRKFLHNTEDAFLCGSSENIASCYKFFDKIIILDKTKQELLENLKSPDRKNPFGKTTKQRENFMEWQEYLIKEAARYNSILLEGNDIAEVYQRVVAEGVSGLT